MCFYQRNWEVVKAEVTNAVKLFFATVIMREEVNDIIIVLIPKCDQPMTMRDFRPINLCWVLYKVVAKCLVNRLRPILRKIISTNQSSFVLGRLITHNVAFECMHFTEHNVKED